MRLTKETVVHMPDQRHDEKCKEAVTQIVCLAGTRGLETNRTEGAKREMEGRINDPCCPTVHLCMAAPIGPVFGGGSTHRCARYRRHSRTYMDYFDCLPLVVARRQSRVSSAETNDSGRHQHR